MSADIKRENESFQQDYNKLYAKGAWGKDELDMMKNLKKLIYYNLAIEAMEEGQGHPGKGHLPEMSYGYRQSYPDYSDMGYNGRRYYGSDKESAMHTLRRMMETTDDPERRHALQLAMNELEMK